MSLTTILFLGSAQAAFLVALIAGKRERRLPDGILATWILVLGLHHLLSGLYLQGAAVPPILLNLNAGVPLLQGPFLFLYVDSLTSGRRRPRPVDALHLLPFLAYAVWVGLLVSGLPAAHPSTVSVFRLSAWLTAAILISVPAYALVSSRKLRRHDADVLEQHSDRRGRDLRWLRRIVLALLGVWAIVLVVSLVPSALGPGSRHGMMGAVTLFIYAIGYFGWRQFAVVEPPTSEVEEPGSPKYERSGLESEDVDELLGRLESFLERDRPHLEPGVPLVEIADGLGTSPNRLSQAMNQGWGKNFHRVINERRVAEFQSRVLEARNRHRTLLAIALDSGFSSKSSFNRVFKQLVGTTPRKWIADATRDRQGERPDAG